MTPEAAAQSTDEELAALINEQHRTIVALLHMAGGEVRVPVGTDLPILAEVLWWRDPATDDICLRLRPTP